VCKIVILWNLELLEKLQIPLWKSGGDSHHRHIQSCAYGNVLVYLAFNFCLAGWRRGVVVSGVRHTSEVNARRARLVLEWVISVCNKPTRSTQPCIPPGSLNRVPASTGVRARMSPLPEVGGGVTLCDPIWHVTDVSSRSGVASLRTAIHLLLTPLLYRLPTPQRWEPIVSGESFIKRFGITSGRTKAGVQTMWSYMACQLP